MNINEPAFVFNGDCHEHSVTPCRKCKERAPVRYRVSGNCVKCAKAAIAARRARKQLEKILGVPV